MLKKSQDFSMEQAKQLMKSPAGQQLLQLLRQQDSGELQKAAELASSGNYQAAGQTLSTLLSSPEAQKLMQELGGK